jgi:hypothetical protein
MGNKSHAGAPKYVDGFRRPSRSAVTTMKRPPQSHAVKTLAPHKPEPAKTLMRTAVKKPDIVAPSKLKAQSRTDILTKAPSQAVAVKLSQASVDSKRLKRAVQTVKHPGVSRYGSMSTVSALQRPAPMSAQSLHVSSSRQASSSPIDRIQSSISHATGQSAVPVVPVASMPTFEPKKDIFSEALAQATSHEQTFEQSEIEIKKERRGAIILTSVLCLLLFVGTFAYLNAPSLSLEVASMKAGFSAKLPSFVPQGFNFGNLSYGKGNVTINYANTLDGNHRYAITQRASNWDSQTLLNNFVSTADTAYQSYQMAGRTIYMYGNNTATWVDSGIWYTVNGNNSLSREQILDLAGSL